MSRPFLLLSLLLAAPPAALAHHPRAGSGLEEPPSRRLARALTATPRLAGTSGSEVAAQLVARELRAAGWQVELDRREVLLSYPRSVRLRAGTRSSDGAERLLFERSERFDPDRIPPGDVPKFNAWSASGRVRAEVIDVGRGLRADYARLSDSGTEPRGRIALARYGGAFRGVKVELAEEAGCVGTLLYSPREDEGAGRGATWPAGPWKPEDSAQRGAIGSLSICPGDPSTPGWASPPPGVAGPRLDADALAARLPKIPCTPLGVSEAEALRAALARGEAPWIELDLDVSREPRAIVNVIARLPGTTSAWVLAGNHRDAWVRGANDAGSGTVSLLRAAQRLGARAAAGWRPRSGLLLGFWDAEEFGLIGSTEWGEANAAWLRDDARAYVNADAVVSGTQFHAGGTPGLEDVLERALARVPLPGGANDATLLDAWRADGVEHALSLAGSGSDHTVFLHHLGVPVLDIGFSGNGGGQYHTRFDDFRLMDRFLDPGWVGHETAGLLLEALLVELADAEERPFDDARAAEVLAQHAHALAESTVPGDQAERLAAAFDALAGAVRDARARAAGATVATGATGTDGSHGPSEPNGPREPSGLAGAPRFLQALGAELPDRPWYRNALWAPGLETGYAAETFPTVRLAAATPDPSATSRAVEELVTRIAALRAAWEALPPR